MKRLAIRLPVVLKALAVGVAGAWLLAALYLPLQLVPDERYITYRVALNLATGDGYRYNPDEPQVAGLWPVDAVLLAAISPLIPEPDQADQMLSAMLIVASGVITFLALVRLGIFQFAAVSAALFHIVSAPLWVGFVSPQHLVIVVLAAMGWAIAWRHYRLAGMLAAACVAAHLPAVCVVLCVGALLGDQRKYWVGALQVWGCLGLVLLLSRIVFQTPNLGLIATTPAEQVIAVIIQSVGLAVGAPLMLLGITRADRLVLRTLVGTALLYVLVSWAIFSDLIVLPIGWAACLLLAAGASRFANLWPHLSRTLLRATARAALVIVVSAAIGEAASSTESPSRSNLKMVETQGAVGQWITRNTSQSSTVGSTHIGRLAFFGERTVIDFRGQLRSDIFRAGQRGDFSYGLLCCLPDYLVVDHELTIPTDLLNALYKPVQAFDTILLFARNTPKRPFTPTQRVDARISDTLRLTGFATDSANLETGQKVRLRLDWESTEGNGPFKLTMLLLRPPAQEFARDTRPFANAWWPVDRFSTFGLIDLEGVPLPEGMVEVWVVAGIADAETPAQYVGLLKVRPPVRTLPQSPLGIVFSDGQGEAVLQAVEIVQGNGVLDVTSYWSTAVALKADYNLYMHLTQPDSVMPLAQLDTAPLYPTSVWSTDEIYVERYSIPLDNVPDGQYRLRVGLYQLGDVALRRSTGEAAWSSEVFDISR